MPLIRSLLDSGTASVVRQYTAGAWPTRGVPTTTAVVWDGPDTSPPPIDVNHAYGGADTLDVWLRRATS
jgi:hypothetical protein